MPKVLIVDDDKHTRTLLKAVFDQDQTIASFGLQVLTAGDGAEGLEIFDRERPDIVVTDLLMPRLDGFRLCEAIRKKDYGKDTVLLVVSGVYRDNAIQSRLREEFAAQFFAKPYQLKDLAAAISKKLGGRQVDPVARREVVEELDPAPLMDGSFAAVPLPQLLLDLYERRATGTIDLRRGRVEKRIDLVVGHPIAVSSNQSAETLGSYLLQKQVISAAQHRQALERAHDEGEKLGEALVELGLLTTGDLVRHLTNQARMKITTALRWATGVWRYQPNRDLLDRAKGNALDPVAVVFLGLRNTAHLDEVTKSLERLGSRRLALTPRAERLRAGIVRAFGDTVMTVLAEPVPASALLGDAPLLAALDALLLSGCVEAVGSLRAATDPPRPKAAADTANLAGLSEVSRQVHADPRDAATPSAPGPQPVPKPRADLYDQLFGEEDTNLGNVPGPEPALADLEPTDGVPTEHLGVEDSGVIDVGGVFGSGPVLALQEPSSDEDHALEQARERLLSEFLRVQGRDWYSLLQIPRNTDAAGIEAAFEAASAAFALDVYSTYDLGRDYAKLEEIHAAYRRAREVLGDPELRAAYDRQLERVGGAPTSGALTAEIAYREGERLLAADDVTGAIEQLDRAVHAMPDAADYHAALGWALHLRGQDARDTARSAEHLGQALTIDHDHPAAHEYTGRVLTVAGGDDERAIDHLERALDSRPPRLGALDALAQARRRRGELRALERRYRISIQRIGDSDRALALKLWTALGEVYRIDLKDLDSARTAFLCAARLAPTDPHVVRALAEITAAKPGPFAERAEALRATWRLEPYLPGPGLELLRAAEQAGQHDAAFVTAGVLVARKMADDAATELHKRFRPRFLVRVQRSLDAELFARVRHPDDDPDLGTLFALLEPLVPKLSPLALADLEVSEANVVPEDRLPEGLARVRAYVAELLGVAPPRVALRTDFGDQVHVGAVTPAVLLVGPDAMELAATDKPALAFRLGRAMTYLWPGRAAAGSRPSRVLKGMLMGAMALTAPALPIDEGDGKIAQAKAVIASGLAAAELQQVKSLVAKIMQQHASVNLSRWARALARSGDRVGMVLAGDVVIAASAVSSLGGQEAVDDLLDFAVSANHLAARAALGISIDV